MEAKNRPKFCYQCGNGLPLSATFCPNCGVRIEFASQASVSVTCTDGDAPANNSDVPDNELKRGKSLDKREDVAPRVDQHISSPDNVPKTRLPFVWVLVVVMCMLGVLAVFVLIGKGQNGGMAAAANTGETKTLTLPGGATMEMIYVAPGSFMMGSPSSEDGHSDNETQHCVTLTKGFWLGKYEVTQRQWQSVMGDNPSRSKSDDRPVEDVTWWDCQRFIQKVNAQLNCGARLPTEAEWEYACRAGTITVYSWGNVLNGDKANCWGHCPCGTTVIGPYVEQTMTVGSYIPNAWGFFDMHGNVGEWCQDWYGDYPVGSVADPKGPASGSERVLRGGTWHEPAEWCRSAARQSFPPDTINWGRVGFRLCCSAAPRE